jgi:hypothetical protein
MLKGSASFMQGQITNNDRVYVHPATEVDCIMEQERIIRSITTLSLEEYCEVGNDACVGSHVIISALDSLPTYR